MLPELSLLLAVFDIIRMRYRHELEHCVIGQRGYYSIW